MEFPSKQAVIVLGTASTGDQRSGDILHGFFNGFYKTSQEKVMISATGIRLAIYGPMVAIAIMMGCGSETTIEPAGEAPRAGVVIHPSSEVAIREIDRQPYELNGCGGMEKLEISKSRTIRHEAEIVTGLSLDVRGRVSAGPFGGAEVGAAVSREVGLIYGEERSVTETLNLEPDPGVIKTGEVIISEVWDTGELTLTFEEQSEVYRYEFRRSLRLQAVSSETRACPQNGPAVDSTPPTATISISPALLALEVSESRALTATLRDGEGRLLTDRGVIWHTSDDGVVIVNQEESLAIAVGPGTARITAIAEGVSSSIRVTVEVPPTPIPTATRTPVPAASAPRPTYTLTTSTNPSQGGTVSGGSTYNAGTTVTVTATPAQGYTFVDWNGACAGTGSCVVTMNGNKSVTANFTTTIINDPPWSGAATNFIPANNMGQSFTLNGSDILTVEVAVVTRNPGRGGDTVTLMILSEGGSVLSELLAFVNEGSDEWLRFEIPGGGLKVTPGSKLSIKLQDTGKVVFFWKYGLNTYPDGSAIFFDSPSPDRDFFFTINR